MSKDSTIQLDFTEEMKNSFRDYAMSVIIDRALPDVRDGLKPVQRRILYSMYELDLDPKKPHRKSARIVGDTMGKYHPHGDSSIYEALVHMSQDFMLNIPFVDGHGNFGSIDGDGAAAMRYTEARLSEGAMTCLEHLEDGLVEFVPNFDNSEKEPVVLPATLPALLINGTTGIAVGMATNMPTHNPGEVIDAIAAYMKNNYLSTRELMQYIKGPDFPTGGIIVNPEDLPAIYETGEGKVRIRAKADIEDAGFGKKNIVITEIPYTMSGNKQKLFESLVALMKDRVFDEISDVRDESSKEGIRIVVEVKKDRDAINLLNGLYKKTALEDTYGVSMLAVKDKQPITFSLYSLIKEFVDFEEEIYTKEYEHLKNKSEGRLEVVNGLLRAADCIDLIVEILRGSKNVQQAKACLTLGITEGIDFKSRSSAEAAGQLKFTQNQAEAILSMQLVRLIGLEIEKLNNEKETLINNIAEYTKILSDKGELDNVIRKTLTEYKKNFGRERRTVIKQAETVQYKEVVKNDDFYVTIDRFGYAKAFDESIFMRTFASTDKKNNAAIDEAPAADNGREPQSDGIVTSSDDMDSIEQIEVEESDGQMYLQLDGDSDTGNITERSDGQETAGIKNDNEGEDIGSSEKQLQFNVPAGTSVLKLNNADSICIFTAQGNMYRIRAGQIPKCRPKDKGTLIHNMCRLGEETPVFFISFSELFEASLLFITKRGYIRRVSGAEFDASRYMIAAAKLEEGDEIVSVKVITAHQALNGTDKVILVTKAGFSLGFTLGEVPEMKKTGRGVHAMELAKNDEIEYMDVVKPDADTFNAGEKTLSARKVHLQKRAGKGRKAELDIS